MSPTFTPGASQGVQPGQQISDSDLTLAAMLGVSETEATAQVGLTRAGVPYSPEYLAAHPDQMQQKTSLAHAIQGFYNLSDDKKSEIQRRLLSGGFYTSTSQIIEGQPDPESVRAYAEAAKRAVIEGKTLDETIDQAAGAMSSQNVDAALGRVPGAPKGKGKRGLPVVGPAGAQVAATHPDDIRAAAMKVSRDLLGQGFNEQQLDHFVQTFQGLQTTQGAAAPTLSAAAEREARTVAPAAAGGTDVANAYDMLMGAVKSLGGGPA